MQAGCSCWCWSSRCSSPTCLQRWSNGGPTAELRSRQRGCADGRFDRSPPRSADRYAALGLARIRSDAEGDGALLGGFRSPRSTRAGLTLLREAADALSLSARGYHRTLRVARTLADLDGEDKVARIHVAEALSYRGETLRRAQAAA